MKRVIRIILILILCQIQIVYAEEFNITSERVVLYNLNDNEIIYELEGETQTQIASLTKIMATIVALEEVDDLNEELVVPREAFNGISAYSQAGLSIGDKVTIKDLLYGAMLPSGADAVNTLALHISGSIDEYVELMNDKASELGLENTHFDNPVGMDSENNYSTASDVAKMLIYALKNETFKEIFTAREYTIPNLNIPMKSTLISYSKSYGLDVSEISGAKSGFTDGAGLCLASTATIDDVDYLLITIGAAIKNRSNAIRDTLEIYHYYSSNYSYQTIMKEGDILVTLPTKWGKVKNYEVKATNEQKMYLENGIRKNKLKYKYSGVEELNYKIKKGDKLGTVTINYRDKSLATYDVYLEENLDYYHPVLYTMIILSVILMIYSIKLMRKSKKKKSNNQKKKTKSKK